MQINIFKSSLAMLIALSICVLPIACGNSVNNQYKEQASATIDSIVALESGTIIETLEFQNLKTPALFNDEIDATVDQVGKSLAGFIIVTAFSGVDRKRDKEGLKKQFISILSPLQEKVKELEADSPIKCFAFLTLKKGETDTIGEKRIYILNPENPKDVEKTINATKSRKRLIENLFLTYASVEDFDMKNDERLEFAKKHAENPVYSFILDDDKRER